MLIYKTIIADNVGSFDTISNELILKGWSIDEPMAVTPVPYGSLGSVHCNMQYSQRFFKVVDDAIEHKYENPGMASG